jgi:hypothetical protein
MTYSRPGTSEVNAFFRPATPNRVAGAPDQRVSLGPSGPLLDNRNASVAGRNAGQGFAEVASFLDQFNKTAAPIYNAYADEQAKKQAGELFTNMDVATLFRSGDPKARDAIRALNPRAETIAFESLAQGLGADYQQRLAVDTANNQVLKNPQSTEDQKAAEWAKIRATAMAGSGLQALPQEYVAPLAPLLVQSEAAVRGKSYEALTANVVQDQDTKIRRKISTDLEGLTASREQLLAAQDFDGAVAWKGRSKQYIQDLYKYYAKEGIYTSGMFAKQIAQSLAERIDFYVARNDFDKADALLRNVDWMAEDGIVLGEGTASPVNLFDLPINDAGRTLGSYVSDAMANLKPRQEEYDRKQALNQALPLFTRMAQGDEGARAQLEAMLPQLANSAETLSSLVSMSGQMQSYGQQPNQAQLEKQLDLEQSLNDPNRNQAEFAQRIRGSDLTLQQKISLMNRNTQPADSRMANVAVARNESADEIEEAAQQITRAQLRQPQFQGADAKTLLEENRRKLRIQATRQTEERITSSDKPVSREDTLSIFRNELEALRNSRMRGAGETAPQALSFDQRVMGEVNEVQANMQRMGADGYQTIKVFPQSVIDGAKARGVPLDYRNVQKYFLNRIGAVKNSKGDEQFPNPQETFRQMIQKIPPVQGPSTRGTTGQQSLSIPMDAMSAFGMGMVQPGNALASLASLLGKVGIDLGGGSAAASTASRAPKPSSSQGAVKPQQQQAQPARQSPPQQELARQVVGGGLAVLARVSDAAPSSAPAAAKPNLADMVINSENLAAMASLWRNERPMSVQTPALPQVVASAPATPVPLAINTDRHPIMVAIGINEGTRTPDGGYTQAYFGHRDPGNGKLNVGTVSGQQGGSPQSSDRRWMGMLTNTAVKVTPLLQRMGIPQSSVGFNRLLFNALDLAVQAPAALPDFLKRLPRIIQAGVTIEAIAKARADSFFNPATGRLEAGGFGNNYARLLADQRSRAGTFDYRRRG